MQETNHPYKGLSAYLKQQYGEKVYKLSLDGGFTCPNRDGTIDTRGCIFCSAGGSGEFATPILRTLFSESPARFTTHIHAQIDSAMEIFRCKKVGNKFIAYFQAYTNTYADGAYLRKLYESALSHPQIIGLSIATRPDCLKDDVLDVLKQVRAAYPDKFIWIELGLQTMHEKTATYIRRGYSLACFEEAVYKLHTLELPIIVHIILGLPTETNQDVLETIHYLNGMNIFGIKLQLLHVLKNTDLAIDYQNGMFSTLKQDDYLELLISCIEHLNPDIILHRVTGDGPKDILIAPTWSKNKRNVLNSLHRKMREGGHYQGRLFTEGNV